MKLQTATIGTALLLGALVATAPNATAQRYSPVGTTWDCLISGSAQKGIAFLTFEEGGTFSGYQLLTARTVSPGNAAVSLRTPLGDVGREPVVTTPGTKTNVFGFAEIAGTWGYDYRWRAIGNYSMSINLGDQVQVYPVSFIGRASYGRTLTLVASTPDGRLTYSGRPYNFDRAVDLTDGNWYATKRINGQSFVEFLTVGSYDDIPGIYVTEGSGSGYTISGVTMLSSRKKVAFALESLQETIVPGEDGDTVEITSTPYAAYGSFYRSRHGYSTSAVGVQHPADKITYKAFFTPAPLVQ
jgi:hypothetical protein